MAVAQQQNEPQILRYLQAARRQYTLAKRSTGWRLVVTVAVATLLPLYLNLSNCPISGEQKAYWAGAASLVNFIALYLIYYEKRSIKLAAQIQEQFDCGVYGLPANAIVTGEMPAFEKVVALSKDYKNNDVIDWYGNTSNLSGTFDVLVSQRNTLHWDINLRTRYICCIKIGLCLLLLIHIGISWGQGFEVSELFLTLLVPSVAAYITGLRELMEQRENRDARKALAGKVESYLNQCIQTRQMPEVNKLRQFQDGIFCVRKTPAVVFNWFARMHQSSYNEAMQAVIDQYADDIRKAGIS